MSRNKLIRLHKSITNTCENCNTYKILYGAERKKKQLPTDPSVFEIRSANTRNPGSSCSTCNVYMALYATIRRRKPSNYGKITKNAYCRYKQMPKEARPPFYVKKCRGEFIKDENGTHFYEVEELTSHNPFRKRTRHARVKSPNPESSVNHYLISGHLLSSLLRRVYTQNVVLAPIHYEAPISEAIPELPGFETLCTHLHEPNPKDLNDYLGKAEFLSISGESWSHEGSPGNSSGPS